MGRWICLGLVLAMWCSVASAQEEGEVTASDQEARGIFLAGQAAFEDARYADALGYFRQAYELSHRVGLLYNIAVAADRLRRDAEALEAFEQFLRDAPEDHPLRRDAEARRDVLRQAARGGPAGGSGDTTGAWIVVGVGAAVALAGGVLLGVGQSDADTVTNAPDGSRWAEVQDAAGRADLLRNTGWLLAGVGLVALAVGVTWVVVAGSGGSHASVAITVGPGSVQLRGEL